MSPFFQPYLKLLKSYKEKFNLNLSTIGITSRLPQKYEEKTNSDSLDDHPPT